MSVATAVRGEPQTVPPSRSGGRRIVAVVVALATISAAVVWWPASSAQPVPIRTAHLHRLLIQWPMQGQAAVEVVGEGRRTSGPPVAVPIASVAKVMTAYVVLRDFPLRGDEPGFTLTLTAGDAEEAAEDKAQGQSYVPVTAGEQLTEREALEALLLPSANNIAQALADRVSGDETAFVAAMNAEAARLAMTDTTYTDPSGLAPTTTSTAADQLRLARAAMHDPVFATIVAMSRAILPVVGAITNTDALLGHDGFVGIKTGSTDVAGGCFMFESVQHRGGRPRVVVGVVLGQHGGPLIHAGLDAARDLVDGIMPQLETTGGG
jgi:serine-type D-Ala-D-Ala carboxypeptidase (penicillin-binding protein 5/6)